MSVPSVKQQLLALYRSNREGAAKLGQWWAVDHYDSCIRDLSARGSGPLPAWAKRDAERFGSLIVRSSGGGEGAQTP